MGSGVGGSPSGSVSTPVFVFLDLFFFIHNFLTIEVENFFILLTLVLNHTF